LMPFYADLRTQAHLRYNLLLRLRKAYHKAIKAVEQGKAVLPFEFEMREGGNERLKRPPTELLVFKLWDRRTLVLAHAKERPPRFSQNTVCEARNGKGTFSPEHNSYLLEFVRAESLDGMSPVVGLWFLELLERDVLGTFSRNSQRNKPGYESRAMGKMKMRRFAHSSRVLRAFFSQHALPEIAGSCRMPGNAPEPC
jgi:hypothetical protein